jgi:hypothetical protein
MTKTTMQRKLSPRAEYLQQEHQRVKDSASLQDRYRELKNLTVEIAYFESEGRARRGEMKYTVNLAHAISGRHEDVSGELVCQGWRSKTTIDHLPCHNILRYKLSIGY